MILTETQELPQVYIDKLPAYIHSQNIKYKNNLAYATGKNPRILSQESKALPDNRVPIPFAKKAISTLQGYATKPGNITYSSSDGKYGDAVKDLVLDPNDEEIKTSELFVDSCTAGYGYELLRINLDLGIRLYRIEPGKGWMVYDNTLEQNPVGFVHIDTEEIVDNGKIVDQYIMTIYYASFFVEYKSLSQSNWIETDRREHPFGMVPAIEYRINPDRVSVFEHVKPLMDELDKIASSDYANELERFANAYLLLAKEITAGDVDDIKQKRIFQRLKEVGESGSVTDSVAFLTKPSRGSDIAEAADRFERWIYEMLMIINPSDEKMGTSSGIALAYRVLPMEWLTASIMAYFTKGLQRRFDLIANAWRELNYSPTPEWITIHERRNLPIDLLSIAQVAGALKGILSDETIIRLFPADIVPDVQAELERMGPYLPLTDEEDIDRTNAD
jgi:SPP1 family phage portal protein